MKTKELPKERAVEVTERPVAPDMTYLPQALVDHFSAQGYCVTMASKLPENVGALAGYGRHPIALNDLPPELSQGDGLALRKEGIWVDPSGLLYKGDCYIFIQSEEHREAQLQEGMRIWLDQADDDDAMGEKAEELTAQIAANSQGHPDVGFVVPNKTGARMRLGL